MKAWIAVVVAAAVSAQPTPHSVESFEKVWRTVQDRYWEPARLKKLASGKSWQEVHDIYRARLENLTSRDAVRALLNKMLGELGQSHYGVLSGGSGEDITVAPDGDGVTGLRASHVAGAILVTEVESDSPAALAGVKPGWEIVRIGETDMKQLVARARSSPAGEGQPTRHLDLLLFAGVRGRLMGSPGSTVTVQFRDRANALVTKKIGFRPPRGNTAQFGFMPPMTVEFESRRPVADVGYVRFSMFLGPPTLMGQFEDAVRSCDKCSGMVIDLRGNPGGLAILAATMTGFFVTKDDLKLGTLYQRDMTLKLFVNRRVNPFPGKLAILVDGASASTSEIMAGGLQDIGRARVFGTRTAGAALPSVIERLPNGDLFQYAIANYISEGGQTLEGRGVTPNHVVELSRAQLLAGKDPVLDAAISWIHESKSSDSKPDNTRP